MAKHPIDVHVGSRVRLRRMMMGISQDRIGEQLNLTFQQIQKYEKGANRIGASRLFTIASILDVPVQFFFDNLPDAALGDLPESASVPADAVETDYVMDFVGSREGLELNAAFSKITKPETRKALVELVKTLA